MTPAELTAVRERDDNMADMWFTGLASNLATAMRDRRALRQYVDELEARLAEAELAAASWKREAELNQQAADESADYAARLAEAEQTLNAANRLFGELAECFDEDEEEFSHIAHIRAAIDAATGASNGTR